MLFYHTRLHCYVVCELKAKTFEPEFAGKLNFYVNAVDELLKTEQDNPTIGLIICKYKNQTEVKWAFKGIQTPMGVASYDNVRMQEIRDVLPTEEEMSKRLELMSKKKQRMRVQLGIWHGNASFRAQILECQNSGTES